MSWLLAFVIIAVAIAALVGGSVLHPVLYGLFIAGFLIVPLWLVSSASGVLFDWLFKTRK
ncbi:MAG: hypothetical protein IJI68_05135 [Eggerthellaceae bacterium]|nr:hypothetical protein [Eggerthellaceae bacterium]